MGIFSYAKLPLSDTYMEPIMNSGTKISLFEILSIEPELFNSLFSHLKLLASLSE